MEKEGFEFRDRVDIFDGGPALHCATTEIRAIRESQSGTVKAIDKSVEGETQLVSNTNLEFRAGIGAIQWNNAEATIDEVTALRLGLKVGDSVRAVELKPRDVNTKQTTSTKQRLES